MYNTLVDAWWPKLYRIAYAKTADRDKAHDMVQEVFLNVWEKWETVPQNEEIEFYLLHALRYGILNYYRSSGRYKVQLQQLDDLLHEIGDSEDEQQYADQRLMLAEHAVTLLSPSLKRVFTLRIHNGYSYDKIGQLLDMDPASARVLYSRALDQLRKTVARKPEVVLILTAALPLVTIS
ncbi:RNA polymerase sigma factor [Taibaiella helva]|uniref:RNA polymerase sigma factor n=1 Tax=Taibaiella helva TaxID=2301235 RepID=UPI000E56F5EA|nr:sigma-70 family RNA polymerase sigma factor [Taibaiella helva]